jgi:hypothetical protein
MKDKESKQENVVHLMEFRYIVKAFVGVRLRISAWYRRNAVAHRFVRID